MDVQTGMKNKDVDLIKKMEKENISLREVKVTNEKLKTELDDLKKKLRNNERENGELSKQKALLQDEMEMLKSSNNELMKKKTELFEQVNSLKMSSTQGSSNVSAGKLHNE